MRSINLVDLVQEINEEMYTALIKSYNESWGQPEVESDDISESIEFYKSLDVEQKALVHNIIKNSAWNAVSGFLAWLDGSFFLKCQNDEDVELKFAGEGQKLNGYLHDIWIEIHQGGDIEEMREFYSDHVFYKD